MFHFHNSTNRKIKQSYNKIQYNYHNKPNSNKHINHNNNNNNNQLKSHKMHLESAKKLRSHLQHYRLTESIGWLQVFLLLTLFVIGNQSAWQENIRPKLYVELGEYQKMINYFIGSKY